MEELKTFKAASEQLALTGDHVAQVLHSTEQLISLSNTALAQSREQTKTASQLVADSDQRFQWLKTQHQAATETLDQTLHNEIRPLLDKSLEARRSWRDRSEQGINRVIEAQRTAAETTAKTLQQDIQPTLGGIRRLARVQRMLILIVLVLLIGNLGLGAWLVQLLMQSR